MLIIDKCFIAIQRKDKVIVMTDEEMLKKIQELVDQKAEKFPFKKSAKTEIVHVEHREDGTAEVLTLGSDMPKLIYRVFEFDAEGNCTEEEDIQKIVDRTKNYNEVIKPTLKLVPPFVEETDTYDVVIENILPDNAVEVKLKSSTGRDITMIETYRYFDYVSSIFFISCVALSFGGQYLFAAVENGKKLKLIVGNNPDIRSRVEKITELLANRALPSYRTIDAGNKALTGNDVRGKVSINKEDGTSVNFLSNFCYDDLESGNMFAFFVEENNNKNGLMFIQDIVTGRLTLAPAWTDAQKAAAEKVQKLMAENREEFTKHVHSFFADSLDLRYAAMKAGAFAAKPEDAPKAEEAKAE